MTFRVGQKVVCVDDTFDNWSRQWIRRGEIYTVAQILPPCGPEIQDHLDSPYGLALAEAIRKNNGFGCLRFRPIVERKTDISFAYEILRKATKPARTPSLAQQERGSENV